ncbi:FecR family protein [Methylomonas sp. UP202]|uniref:FecR family protein n=1 Tax=Methylomonas sp. UP202 TaxID=3040943 RepID=UPI002478C602|nr:FecR family protein [Methylomonas sp. UP202]WGS83840.1 FecR family protein [Methylomonas sp. UP202]
MSAAPESKSTQLKDQAIEWLIRLNADHCPAAERAAFESWLEQSPAHAAAYIEVLQRMQWLERVGRSDELGRQAALQHRPAKSSAFSQRVGLAVAATVLLGAGLATFSPFGWYGFTSHYSAERGERRTVKLSDGTQLELNTDSQVAVRVNRNQRNVEVVRGEVYFSVVHNPDQPFVVDAGAGRSVDIGTEFEIYRKADQVIVAVQEGRVRVEAKQSRDLTASQVAAYDNDGHFVDASADGVNLSAWRRGKLIFDNRRLDDVLAEIGRYHRAYIGLADPALAGHKVSGTFFTERLEDNLAAIAGSLNLRVRHIGDGQIQLAER